MTADNRNRHITANNRRLSNGADVGGHTNRLHRLTISLINVITTCHAHPVFIRENKRGLEAEESAGGGAGVAGLDLGGFCLGSLGLFRSTVGAHFRQFRAPLLDR